MQSKYLIIENLKNFVAATTVESALRVRRVPYPKSVGRSVMCQRAARRDGCCRGPPACRWMSASDHSAHPFASVSSARSSVSTRLASRTSRRSGPARISRAPGTRTWSRIGCVGK